MFRQYRLIQRRLFRTLLQHPRSVMALSMVCSVAALGALAAGAGRSRPANVAAVVLVTIGVLLSLLGGRMAKPRRLAVRQRRVLLQALRRLGPLEVRVSAVGEPEAIRYARDLRNAMTEARWPVTGVFKCKENGATTGVTLAVRNVVAPPGEAITLMNTLRRIGIPASWGHNPELREDRTIEVQVGPPR